MALCPQTLPGKLMMAPGQLEGGARYHGHRWGQLGDSLAGQRAVMLEKRLQSHTCITEDPSPLGRGQGPPDPVRGP